MNNEQHAESSAKKPTHEVFVVEPGKESDRGFWHKIGAGWENQRGVITTKLFASPMGGEMVVLPVGYKK